MVEKQLSIEGARIGFRNFEGREGQYNSEGDRNFAIFLEEPGLAEKLAADGWNVKFPKERESTHDEDDQRNPYLQVSVSFKVAPPRIVMINSETGKATKLDESEVGVLDWAEIQNVDVVLRPYHWSVRGESGIKAYLKAIYVTVVEDRFASKYDIY